MVLEEWQAHSELDVARSICSSSWEEDANQPAIILDCATPKCCRFCLGFGYMRLFNIDYFLYLLA
jgi:hypothetical protein